MNDDTNFDDSSEKNEKLESNARQRQIRHLPESAILEESGSPRLIIMAISAVGVILLLFLLWATFVSMDEIASAPGEIIPAGQIRVVQHLEGGIVSEIYVSNDEEVKKGQILVKLNSAAAYSELSRMRSREMALRIDLMRLRAFVDNKPVNADKLYQDLSVIKDKINEKILKNMIDNGIDLYKSQVKSRSDDITILDLQVKQKQEELAKLKDQKINTKQQIELLTEEQAIYKNLEDDDSVSRVTLLSVSRQLNQAYGTMLDVTSNIYQTEQALAEARQRLEAKEAELKRDALEEITVKEAELLDIVTSIERTEDRVTRLSIKAPESGVVKGLDLTHGAVVAPGAVVCEVVPLHQEMMVEARLDNADIGHISVGDNANVKVTTYDFVRYGQVTGKVKGISAATFLSDDGVPYYKVNIKLDKSYVGSNAKRNRLLPGMVVTADIITGEKSLLSYLLKPIHRSLQEAFKER